MAAEVAEYFRSVQKSQGQVTGLYPRQVATLQCNQVHPERPACEDTCCAIFEMEGGVQATVSVDYFRPEAAGTHGDDWVRVVGTEGILEARANEALVTLMKNGTSPEPVQLDEPEKLFAPFIAGREGLTGTGDAIELSRACVYARQAADENRVIKIDCYHISYYANNPFEPGRITSNLRKNSGFYLVANGPAGIHAGAKQIYRIALLKEGGTIRFAVNGREIIQYTDDGQRRGPPHGGGKIGLRQMELLRAQYRNLRIYSLR